MAIVFGVGNVFLSTILGPSRKGETKGMTYESGMNPIGSTRRRFNVRFYMVAMTFLLFDVEIVFLYPWATNFGSLGEAANAEVGGLYLLRMLFFRAHQRDRVCIRLAEGRVPVRLVIDV